MKKARYFAVALLLATLTLLNTGCGALGTRIDGWEGVKRTESLVVLPFRDNVSEDSNDSDGTGKKCQTIMVEALSDRRDDTVKSHVPANHDFKTVLSQMQANTLGKTLKVDYVVYGDCIEFYDVAPMTFRADRAGMQVFVLRVVDGVIVYTARYNEKSDSNFDSPEDVIQELSEGMAKGILAD